ncbi:alpha/beta hydrolase [Halalkalibacterium ligniniphilum]|uniref:alpha/beta hydrolase n=1 Tax=Halalkalibacterium ligniniphilum TaxID=1134413 RepID=UPI00034DE8FD|nr:alpha/beta hydrolase [Halalkalibacterium ligniniphilum]
MTTESVTFKVREDILSAVIHKSKQYNHPAAIIVFVHGFVGSKVGEHRLFVKAARRLAEKGYTVMRFDFVGSGESSGDYKDVTISRLIEELKGAIEYILLKENQSELTLIGHSLGGAISSLVAGNDPRVKQLILWSPVARPYEDITRITGSERVEQAKNFGTTDYQGFGISDLFFEDLKKHQPLRAITTYKGAFAIFHGENDKEVPPSNAFDYAAAFTKHNPSYHVPVSFIKHAGHTFSHTKWEEELFEKTEQLLYSHTTVQSK